MTDLDLDLAADLAALRAMEPQEAQRAEPNVRLRLTGKIAQALRVADALVGNIHTAVGDPERKLSPVELVERCRNLHQAVGDPRIISLTRHRTLLREDIRRGKGGMHAGIEIIPIQSHLLNVILDVLDDIEAARSR